MKVTGRIASENLLYSLNHNNGDNGGSENDNINIVRQTFDRGYEGSSEDTQRQSVNVSNDCCHSHSRQHHAQQLGSQNHLPPTYRRRRCRRRLMRKQGHKGCTTNIPPPNSINTFINSNNNINAKLPDHHQQYNLKTVSSTRSAEGKPQQQQQQKQHDRSITRPFNEMQSDKIVKTCITNGDIKLTFQVQLAHGSPTGIISGFNNITELYQAIANCYDEITTDDILFCTVNTHRISMDALLCSNININDFIFAHIAGQKKKALGLTITDNGAGKAFIKRIIPGTITSKAKPALEIGDFIEKINGKSMVGQKHYDVAQCLRMLPVGSMFTMRLIEPKRTGFNFIASYNISKCMRSILGTNETVRFKADGTIVVQEMPNALIINKMNDIFDSYFGFHDNDLAQTIWEMIASCKNFNDLKNVLKKSDINDFNFPTELYFDLWGMVDDYRNDRFGKSEISMKKSTTNEELLSDK
ncbi:PDZ domain-containing protein GIPC1 [Dirofilaria immitis]|nr:PDZ domain-containing protein GIPC1 [Dirofilaria immitis]